MAKRVVASILHGAYGDVFEQALCLRHYAQTHPEVDLRLFGSTETRYTAFCALDLSFASRYERWTEIQQQPEIDTFYQFQVMDKDLQRDVLNQLPPEMQAKIDRSVNHLPWHYMRDHGLLPPRPGQQLRLSAQGERELSSIMRQSELPEGLWERPTISFLWRYRHAGSNGHAISSLGQKSESQLVEGYSRLFRTLLQQTDAHLLVFGMNLKADGAERVRTDNKYAHFGLDVPADRVSYMKGLNWPLELEIAARTTLPCGNASGFTEALWLKGRDVLLMDPPPHYLAKVAKHRMGIFNLNRPGPMLRAWLRRSPDAYLSRAQAMLAADARSAQQ